MSISAELFVQLCFNLFTPVFVAAVVVVVVVVAAAAVIVVVVVVDPSSADTIGSKIQVRALTVSRKIGTEATERECCCCAHTRNASVLWNMRKKGQHDGERKI